MAKLIANTPCAGLLPVTIGKLTITEFDAGPITLVAPFAGKTKAVTNALKADMGLTFPAPNRSVGSGPHAVWCGMGQALIMGGVCPDLPAACVDQSDAWAIVRIEGADAAGALARLTPIDLRPQVFKRGLTARTLVGHMTASVTCLGENLFEIMVMRSMAGTLVHELETAARNMASRAVALV